MIDVIEYNGGSVGSEKHLYEANLRSAGVTVDRNVMGEQRTDTLSLARDETIAYLFLFGADKIRFGKLLEDIEDAFTQGDDKFPTDLTHAYKLLTNWKQYVPPADDAATPTRFCLPILEPMEEVSPNRCHSPTWAATTPISSDITASIWATMPTTEPIIGSREHPGLPEAAKTTTKYSCSWTKSPKMTTATT